MRNLIAERRLGVPQELRVLEGPEAPRWNRTLAEMASHEPYCFAVLVEAFDRERLR